MSKVSHLYESAGAALDVPSAQSFLRILALNMRKVFRLYEFAGASLDYLPA